MTNQELPEMPDPTQTSMPSDAPPSMLVMEEQLQVGKQLVETGRVLISKTVTERDEIVRIPLLREEIEVERVAIDQYVDDAPATRQEGDTMIYPVLREVIVVEKRLLLVEEIRVTRRRTETQEVQTHKVRSEEVTVKRSTPTPEQTADGKPLL